MEVSIKLIAPVSVAYFSVAELRLAVFLSVIHGTPDLIAPVADVWRGRTKSRIVFPLRRPNPAL
jgi:hypothetical protein